jgi:hypothetical protein
MLGIRSIPQTWGSKNHTVPLPTGATAVDPTTVVRCWPPGRPFGLFLKRILATSKTHEIPYAFQRSAYISPRRPQYAQEAQKVTPTDTKLDPNIVPKMDEHSH